MVKIIIICHGNLAQEFKSSLKMIVGDSSDIYPISFKEDEGTDDLLNKIENTIKFNKLNSVIIFADIYGGSPFNAAIRYAISDKNVEVIAGVNLPILIDTYLSRDTDLINLIDKIQASSQEFIKYFNKNSLFAEDDDL
ncbi:PTS sugar transporter subunit IIA [Aerococcus urinae]|uniref:PTS sugar transporter subunit IIA n=1 Tax=Aerococcus urinae TaxID=1376 RepID=A0A109RG72_9LACT|nr:PTS sugar transporter subunit IIA [Aerococcus urinae]AMB96445.1 hypothetical protein AWM73_07995 [Aerococcus urinae]MCY3032182.1 PTS sugar transporter subunit IIA [Aerococcus urinae]MCY3037688.1 PTS sugar transporter subunit IIA [Aerococcus urinae]MCY3044228.1 PTS sugar transporter subunit IIA [Aerococcus urinae]MCY3045647.1 PTS sugar transporter subunit IIA [Aerococcus urinae]